MASIEVMRDYVSRKYSGDWPDKVRRMPNDQVTAIYMRMIHQEEKAKAKPKKLESTTVVVNECHQLSFLDDNHRLQIKEEYVNERNHNSVQQTKQVCYEVQTHC